MAPKKIKNAEDILSNRLAMSDFPEDYDEQKFIVGHRHLLENSREHAICLGDPEFTTSAENDQFK